MDNVSLDSLDLDSDADGEIREPRRRQRTEKGREYIAHLRWRDCQLIGKKIQRQIKEINSLSNNVENVTVIEGNLSSFRITVEEFKGFVAALLRDLDTDEELSIANDWYAEQNKCINDFIEKTVLWISSAKDSIEQNLEERSQVSSKHTHASRRSQASSRPSITTRRAKERAKAAELMTRVAMLERKQELEKTAEKLRLEEQLAVAQVRERVFAEIEDGAESDLRPRTTTPLETSRAQATPISGSEFPPLSVTLATPASFTTPPTFSASATFTNPSVSSTFATRASFTTPVALTAPSLSSIPAPNYAKGRYYVPEVKIPPKPAQQIQFCDVLQEQNRLTRLLAEQQQRSLLPSLTLTKFTGDPLEYSTFIRSFESQVEARVSANDVRLQYLEQYLGGEPKDLIKGCLHLDHHSGFEEAKRLLEEKYGDPYKISNAYIKRINEWPCIRAGDDRTLDRFSVFLTQCRSAMSTLTFLSILDHPHNLQSMVTKLPFYLQDRWRREANKKRVAGGEIPTFTDFVSFVKAEAGIATDPVFSREALRRLDSTSERSDRSNRGKGSGRTRPPGNRTRDQPHFSSHATDVTADRRTADVRRDLRNSISLCKLCGRDHDLDDCQAYLKKTLSGRKEFLRVKGLCFACYEIGHRSNGCAQRRTCKRCLRRHPTGLHDDNFRPTQPDSERQSLPHVREEGETVDASTETEAACNATGAGNSVSAVPIVPVRVRSPLREVLTYAMLDTCSTGTFLLEDLAVSLGVTGSDTQLVVKTVNGTKSHNAKVLNGLVVTDLNGSNAVQLPKTYTREDLISCENVPSPEIAFKWKHLERIAGDIPPPLLDARIGLLIGTNCPKALEPIDVLASEDGGPFAIKTFAGWAVVGPLYMSNKEHQMVDCNRIAAEEVGTNRHLEHHFMVENRVKEIVTPQALNMLLEQDFSERIGDKDQEYSLEDKKFLKIVNREVRRTEDGHYEIPLPFRCDVPSFPENRQQILERMEWLKRKISKSEKIHEDYTTFMNGIIAQGFASRVPPDRLTTKPGRVWFIPHHCVYHAKKPNKIRVVFDCSARFGGVSLNDQLIQGPDLTNRLVGVLTRFRQGPIAFMGDIDAMFHQVRVPDSHRDFLRFLWWPEGDLTQDLEEYQMNVHLFGAVSSPSCSNFALLKAADDTEKVVGSETADVLRKNFYVDDCLRSEETEDFAIQRIRGVRDACAHGGFNLAKFVSNSRTVLESVPEEARAQNVKSLELSNSILSVERALGVQWAIESDTFGFRIILKDQPLTRRGILSTVSSVYDPLGIAAPVLLVGKQILQDLCRRKQGWDEEVDEEFRARWKNWKSQLPALERFSMERCLKPTNFGTVVSRQVHSFSDASSTGYGQVSYLRIENEKGDVHCAFLMGKARVAPVKAMTIPRLELTAATVSVRVGEMIANELDEPVESKTYWTDSTTVLKYVRNEKKRFHVFVANRVQAIREATSPEQWKYVESKVNPADDASRGLKGYELSKEHRWITGPNFLWLPESEWPQIPYDLGVSADDPEIKRVQVHSLVIDESSDLLKRLTRFSDWRYMKRSVAWMLRLANKESHTVPDKAANKAEDFAKLKEKPIRVDEVEKAETAILKVVQKSAFPTEIEALKKIKREDCENDRHYEKSKKHEIKKSSVLYRLDPFLDQNGLLRVGGRLSKSQEFPEDFKHPVILPKRSSVVNLIVRDAHKKVAHAGRGITLSELRSQYWIVNANSVVRHFISKCIVCRRLRGTSGEQKMAVLPRERITPSPPFTYCGVDYFGPFFIKQGRKEVKRYGAIFTCLASRAVHIETAESLETDSFINALRRFIARRGPVREIRSDQGTNIVGAANELKKALEEMDHSVIQRSLCRGFKADWIIRWKKNPPAASHMGGVWERQIRSIRSILSALLKEFGHCLNDETFRTLLTEVECILNSRPLTVPSSDPDDLNPLTPNHILTMKSRVVMPPPGNFQKADVYLRKRWKRVQYLSNVFWSRWRKEYVQSLQQRVKWNRPRRNLQSGDLVLIVDDRVARNKWNLARVVDTNPDSDGQVRSVRVATATTTLDRPIDKLVLIMENEE